MSGKRSTLANEFASTMQQLAAEAEKATPRRTELSAVPAPTDDLRKEFDDIQGRLAGLERAMNAGLDKLTAGLTDKSGELEGVMQRVDENLVALRKSETVNQRLFNSMHDELKAYRDNFMRDSLQKPFIRDLVVLFDDLSTVVAQMQSAGAASQWCGNLENAIHAIIEILQRMDVTIIEPRDKVERTMHRVVSYEPADFEEEDEQIVLRLKRGFLWRGQLLRPEEVVAKRFN